MDAVPACFSELRGVGPAIEARLHEAGIHTWEALAAVLAALSQVSAPEGDPLRDLAAQVAERASAAAPAKEPDNAVVDDTTPGPQALGDEAAPAASSRDHTVHIDAGRAVGGSRRDLTLAVATGGAGFDYRARLIARQYGAAQSEGVEVGALAGATAGQADLTMCFPAVDLPPRLQRLAIELDLRLAEPGGIPALSVVARP